jgi:broad specificity phosphatase PhoE
MMQKTLLITRHAHRDVTDRSLDNGVSSKGMKQIEELKNYFFKHYSPKNPQILSSPRLRCQETIAAIGKFETSDLLDERGPHEIEEEFYARIDQFIEWWKNKAHPFLIICSHGDWIPLFFFKVLNNPLELKKAGLAELTLENGEVHLKNFVPDISQAKK